MITELILGNVLFMVLVGFAVREWQHRTVNKIPATLSATVDGVFEPLVERVDENSVDIRTHAGVLQLEVKAHVSAEIKKVTDAMAQLKNDVTTAMQTTSRKNQGLGNIIEDYINSSTGA